MSAKATFSKPLQKTRTEIMRDLEIEELRDKYAVFGYVRQRVHIFIPIDVTKLIVAYYKSQDDWDKLLSHSSITILDDYIAENTAASWVIAFGRDKIEHGVKVWKLKIFKIDSAIIGIVPTSEIEEGYGCNIGDFTEPRHKLNGYGLCTTNGVCYSYKDGQTRLFQVRMHDIVAMKLDLASDKGGVLSYKINDEAYRTAFNNIDISKGWTVSVGFHCTGKVQLLR